MSATLPLVSFVLALFAMFGPTPQPAGSDAGTIAVRVVPRAAIYLDGRLVSNDPGEHPLVVAPGPHRLRIVHPEYEDLLRVVDVSAGQTTRVEIALSDKGIRKRANRAGTTGGPRTRVTDPELLKAIQFVSEGDFAPAVETLEAVVRSLANVPRFLRELAVAYLYLGVAYAELDRVEDARVALARAQQVDASVAPQPASYSAQIVRLWEESRTVDPGDFAPPLPPTLSAPAADEQPADAAPPPPAPAPPAGEAEFMSNVGTATEFLFALKAPTRCRGRLSVDRESRIVSWKPDAAECSAAFEVPAAELRSPAVAPYGGVLIQFRSERPPMTLVPAPDADLLDPEVEPLPLNELPASARVNLRQAIRRLGEALGRPASDTIFGLQVDLPLDELLSNPADFEGASVRTRGVLVQADAGRGRYTMTAEGQTVQLQPSAATVQLMASKAAEWRNVEVQVSGTFSRFLPRTGDRRGPVAAGFVISVAAIEPAAGIEHSGRARLLTIRALATAPPPSSELVRIIGRYRGRNWFGDLPADSQRNAQDWVLSDGPFALWVTGHRPEGDGFSLGSSTLRDSREWLAVTGTVEERRGIVYLKARRVELSPAPDEAGKVTAAFATGMPAVKPDIAFLAPIEGVEPAAPDQQFLLRFTKPMDESTFKDRVQVRYSDQPEVPLPRTSVTYYAERTFSIMVDPGQALQPGRTIELVLKPGIKDLDGHVLVEAGARVFKWSVAAGR